MTTYATVTALDEWPSFIDPLADRMSGRYGVPASDVRRLAIDIHAQFANVPVRSFVEILVEKQVRDTLRGQAR